MSWNLNPLRELLGIRYPIIQAPMLGSSTPALAAAVSNAGGLGSMGCTGLSPDAFQAAMDEFRAKTNRPVNVNFFCHAAPTPDPARETATQALLQPYYDDLGLGPVPEGRDVSPAFDDDNLAAVLAARPQVVSFHFGMPGEGAVRALKEAGILILASATNVPEARALDAAGADVVIAQGYEAGGHRGTFTKPYADGQIGTMALVPQVVDAVSVPVVAAGGIADGRGIAAALMLGAQGAQVGTAFLSCPEALTSDSHREELRTRAAHETAITHAFSGRPARGIDNRVKREMAGKEDLLPDFPLVNAMTAPMRKAAKAAGRPEFQDLWAGQAFPLNREMPAGDLLETLAMEVDVVLGDPKAEPAGRPPAR